MAKKETNCKDGITSFFMKNIPCELMDWFRQHAQSERRAISSQIIIALEDYKNKNEQLKPVIP